VSAGVRNKVILNAKCERIRRDLKSSLVPGSGQWVSSTRRRAEPAYGKDNAMEFLDPTSIREALSEETLKVKTGIRAGNILPPPICYYGVVPQDPPYAVE